MEKIAFVVQRYGLEVNGGAESLCRQYAERMKKYYNVEVITSKAIDYVSWKNEYTQNEENINGVIVRRFSVEFRDIDEFDRLSDKIMMFASTEDEEKEWMRRQGPYSEELFSYIASHKDEYFAFIFFTYLYATTFFGLPLVKEKAVLIPTAHDETPIYLGIFENFFRMPHAIFYNTPTEQKFVESVFHCKHILNNHGEGGVGIDVPLDTSAVRFYEKYGMEDFILYVGRIEEHKGCKELFSYFCQYKRRNPGNTKLVLIGRERVSVPDDPDIVSLGFVEEQDKYDALAACRLLVLPSQFESLSMVVLEAMAVKRPVLVHADCEVVRQHCIKSNGGLYYRDYPEFEGCLNYFLTHPEIGIEMGKNGAKYVRENYCWDVIERHLKEIIDHTGGEN